MNHSPNQKKQKIAKPDKRQLGSAKQRWIAFAVLAVVVVGASASAALLLHQPEKTADEKSLPTQSTTEKSEVMKKADAAQKLAYGGDVQGGLELLDRAIENTDNKDEKTTYTTTKAALQLSNKDTEAAYETVQSAYKLNKTSNTAAAVAQIARKKGDTQTSIEYYQKSIELIDSGSPVAQRDKRYYQAVIDQIKEDKK